MSARARRLKRHRRRDRRWVERGCPTLLHLGDMSPHNVPEGQRVFVKSVATYYERQGWAEGDLIPQGLSFSFDGMAFS